MALRPISLYLEPLTSRLMSNPYDFLYQGVIRITDMDYLRLENRTFSVVRFFLECRVSRQYSNGVHDKPYLSNRSISKGVPYHRSNA